MNKTTLLAGLALWAVGTALPAQDPTPAPAPAPEAGKPAADAGRWIRQLGAESFKDRVEAEKHLRAMGRDALPALQEAKDSDDAEVQWRARRLIRQIEKGATEGLEQRPDRADGGRRAAPQPEGAQPQQGQDVEQRFRDLFHGLERDFGLDIPRGRFFNDDFFHDLRSQMDEMRRQVEQMRSQALDQAQGGMSRSVQIGPDGVRAEVKTRNERGELESKVYEAPDLETFQQKYPDVLGRNGVPFVQFQADGNRTRPLPRGMRLHPEEAVEMPPADRRLGVTVRDTISADLREYLGLPEDRGLMVQSVQDGTLAQQLGLRANDVVLSIGGRPIASAADVQQALAGIAAGQKVEVELNRRGEVLKVSADKPAVPPADAPAPKTSGKLERR